MQRWGTTTSDAFLWVTHALARPPLPAAVRNAFMAPYRGAGRRAGVGNFVADIPADTAHPSFPALTRIADGLRGLSVPALMLWGPKDPIFSDRYLKDLLGRLPHAQVHRFEGAGHLVAEDRDIAAPVFDWLTERGLQGGPEDTAATAGPAAGTPDHAAEALWAPLSQRAAGPAGGDTAVAEMAADGSVARSLSWLDLEERVAALAAGLQDAGVGTGSRVSLMVPPGVDLTVVLYACLRLGAVVVVADAGLGTRGLSRAVKGATPDVLIGIDKALAAAAVLGWSARRISVRDLPAARRRGLGVQTSLAARARVGAARRAGPGPGGPPLQAPEVRPPAEPEPEPADSRCRLPPRTPPPPCSSRPVPPDLRRACCTHTGSWRRCGTPWPRRSGSGRAPGWWPVSRRSPCWDRRSARCP